MLNNEDITLILEIIRNHNFKGEIIDMVHDLKAKLTSLLTAPETK